MTDLLKRQDVLGAIQEAEFYYDGPDTLHRQIDLTGMMRHLLVDIINDIQPSVDVVKCRDCKHYRPNAEPKYEMCRHHIIYMEPEDWCSYGERREP